MTFELVIYFFDTGFPNPSYEMEKVAIKPKTDYYNRAGPCAIKTLTITMSFDPLKLNSDQTVATFFYDDASERYSFLPPEVSVLLCQAAGETG